MRVSQDHTQSLQLRAQPKPAMEDEFSLMAVCVLHLGNSKCYGNGSQQFVKR